MGSGGRRSVCSAALTDGVISDKSGSYVSSGQKIIDYSKPVMNCRAQQSEMCNAKAVVAVKLKVIVLISCFG